MFLNVCNNTLTEKVKTVLFGCVLSTSHLHHNDEGLGRGVGAPTPTHPHTKKAKLNHGVLGRFGKHQSNDWYIPLYTHPIAFKYM